MDAKDVLRALKETMRDHGEGKVIKSVPATKEEIALQLEMDKDVDKAIAILEATEAKRKKFWAMVNTRLDSFDHNALSYNDDTKEIEYRQDN